jgi:hypothetical protein
LLLLAACADGAAPDAASSGSAAKPFPALEAEAVLAKGFQAIMEFSLEDADPAVFALEGTRGLGSIDPNLVAGLDEKRLTLRLGEETVFAAPRPGKRDPRGWSRLLIEGLLAARGKSQMLAEAGPEEVYQAVFDAALSRSDRFSRYAGAAETKKLRARREGQTESGTRLPSTVGLALGEHVALIQVIGFNQETAGDLEAMLKETQSALGRQWKGLVLDLRGNPGGLLEQAVKCADLFLGPGRVVSARGRHPMASVNHEAAEGDLAQGIPIVALIDGNTASSAEVLAAALQDRGRAVVAGTVSYGKGLVQTVVELPNGGEIDISWSRLHSPSGYAIDGLGVLPNLCTVKGAKGDGLASGADFAQWRTAGLGSPQARNRLRALCPPGPAGSESEAAAMRLLSDKVLFTKALAPTGAALAFRP